MVLSVSADVNDNHWTKKDHKALSKGRRSLKQALEESLDFNKTINTSKTKKGKISVSLTKILIKISKDLIDSEKLSWEELSQIRCTPRNKSTEKNEANCNSSSQQSERGRPQSTLTLENVVDVCIAVARHSNSSFELEFRKNRSVFTFNTIMIGVNTSRENIDFATFEGADSYILNKGEEGVLGKLNTGLVGLVKQLEILGLNVPVDLKLTKETVKDKLDKMRPKAFGYEKKLEYIKELVSTEGSTNVSTQVILQDDCTKSTVTVVAGESGSGKSVYAQTDAIPDDASVLYGSTLQKHFPALVESVGDFDPWKKLVRVLFLKIQQKQSSIESSDFAITNIRLISEVLNSDRNKWALQVFDNVINETKAKDEVLRNWLDSPNPPKLEKLVIVIDEAGRDFRFADGLIAMSRSLLTRYQKYATELALIICGSGLDTLQSNPYGETGRFLGSDPSLSQTVIMKTPDLTKISGVKGWPSKEAIEGGSVSRILATNARLLTHGVCKVLSSDIVTFGVEGQELLEKQAAFGSFLPAMDYCVRKFGSLNGLKDMSDESKDRLYLNAFRYMHNQQNSQGSIPDGHHLRFCTGMGFVQFVSNGIKEAKGKAKANRNKHENEFAIDNDIANKNDNENIEQTGESQLLRIGVARQHFDNTSSGLKFMACKGRTFELIPGDGISFENVVAMHMFRMMQSRLTGHKTSVVPVVNYTLKSAWPPALPHKDPLKMQAKIDEFKKNDDITNDIENLRRMFPIESGTNHAIILRQSISNAQGFDVGVLLRENKKYELLVFQCKHWKKGVTANLFEEALPSLGLVEKDGSPSTAVATEADGSAFYTNECTEHLIASVSGLEDYTIRRVICVSNHTIGKQRVQDEKVELWKYSMFEPTVSALDLKGLD